jgi:hypothetical protein
MTFKWHKSIWMELGDWRQHNGGQVAVCQEQITPFV